MPNFSQNQPNMQPGGNSNQPQGEDKKQGAIIYFIGIIVVSVVAVGYLVMKVNGLL